MLKNYSGFAPILVILILGIIGVVGYLMLNPKPSSLYPSPAPTTSQAPNGDLANWKTYTNKKYNYQVSYPSNWQIEALYPKGEPIESAQDIDFRKFKDKPWYAENQIVFTILVHPNPKQPSLSEFLIKGDINIYHPAIEEFATLKDEEESRRKTVEKMEKTTLNAFEALRYRELESQLKLFVNTKSNIFLIYLHVSENITPINPENLFDQILSTFKFLEIVDESSLKIPSDWKKIEASGKFSFYIPPYLKKDDTSSGDSYTEGYSNENFKLSFDYGPFSDNLDSYNQEKEYQEDYLIISGKLAKIVSFRNTDVERYYGFSYIALINFSNIDENTGDHLTLNAFLKNKSDLEISDKIFRSIAFPK